MIISESDALWAADQFIDYFGRFKTIEDYIRLTKEAAIKQKGTSLFSLKDGLIIFFTKLIIDVSTSSNVTE